MSGARYIYFIRPVGAAGPIKIGCSAGPDRRLAQYAQWSPVPLEIVATITGDLALERNLHECFADCHSHHEWFHATPRLLAFLDKIVSGISVDQAVDLSDRRGTIRKKARNSRSAEQRLYLSYLHRVRHVEDRLSRVFGYSVVAPNDVRAILSGASEYDRANDRSIFHPLTPEQRARLDEILRQPADHFLSASKAHAQRRAA